MVLEGMAERPEASVITTRNASQDPSWDNLLDFSLGTTSIREAESVAAVAACIDVIAAALASLPPIIRDRNTRRRAGNQRVEAILMYPNEYQSWTDFVQWYITQCLLHGNALAYYDGDDLLPIPWTNTMVSKSPTGRLVYDFNDAEGARYRFSSQYAMHMRDKTDDGMIGRSRLARSGASVEHAKELSDAVEALFYNGVTPSLAITVNGRLSPESRDQLTAQIRDQFAGVKNRGKFLVLDSTESVTNIDVTAEDSELLESRRFSVVEICRLFGVPPPLAQSYEHNTFTNSQEATRWFSTFTLSHWARKFEQAFSRTMLPKSLELELDMSAFTRSDTGERWNAYQIALANGVLTPEQVRELEGWEV